MSTYPHFTENPPPDSLSQIAPHIERLCLVHFRNHATLQLCTDKRTIVLYGPNGAGKTSILEAISLLNVGKGLQQAAPKSLQHQKQSYTNHAESHYPDHTPWSVTADYKMGAERTRIATAIHANKRKISLDGETIKHQDVAHRFNSFWLTPEMEHLLRASSHEKRRFLDQIIGRFDREHPRRVAKFETLQRQYSLLCMADHGQSSQRLWRETLKEQLVQATIALSSSRIGFVGRFNRLAQSLGQALPTPHLAMEGEIAQEILAGSITTTENFCHEQLAQVAKHKKPASLQDRLCVSGPHHMVQDSASCSSGERKALMMATILVIARLWLADKGFAPLLLLDDITGHLDTHKRKALWHDIQELGGQVWLTGQEPDAFSGIEKEAAFFHISPGHATQTFAGRTASTIHPPHSPFFHSSSIRKHL